MRNVLLIVLMLIFVGILHISAQVPNQISWQGVLTDAQGDALQGNYDITTKLFNQSVGGDALWVELHTSKQIEDGQVNLILGSIENLNLQFNQPYWLEITVGAGDPLSRIQLTSVPYSLYSANSNPVIINDSLVLKDSLGVTRMVFNPNTGTFSMMDNDTVWYSMSVNSPVKVFDFLPNGYIKESFTNEVGASVQILKNTDGNVIEETISEISMGGQITETLTNHYDSEGRLISSNFISRHWIGGVPGFETNTINKTFDPLTNEVINESSSISNGFWTTDDLDSKAEKLNGVLVRTIENANGETETKTFNAVGNTLTHRISSNDGNKTEIISGEQSTVVEQTPLGLSISKPESNSTCSLNLGTIANVFPATVCSFDVSTNSGTSTSLSIVDQGSSGFRVNIHDFLTIHKPTSLLANTSCSGNLTLFGNLTMSSVAGTATLKNTSCTGLSVNGITNLNSLANTQSINASGDITTTEFVNCANLYATGYGTFGANVIIYGDLWVIGFKEFKIDHPDDPLNKSLSHVCIESNEAINQYSGNVVTDANGYVVVTLPDYVEKINIDFRYQLTVIGDFAQAIISKKIQNNQFEIRTDKPNTEVSWLITAKRNDSYAKDNPFQAVRDKTVEDKGKLLRSSR